MGWIFRKPTTGSFDQLFVFRILCDIGSFVGVGSVVVKFPLSGGVMNCSVVESPNGNMARFFDSKGRALADFRGVHKPWDKADAIKIVYWRKLA